MYPNVSGDQNFQMLHTRRTKFELVVAFLTGVLFEIDDYHGNLKTTNARFDDKKWIST